MCFRGRAMHPWFLNGLLLLGVCMTMAFGFGPSSMLVMDQDRPRKRCYYDRAYSMLQAKCSDLGLTEIPPNLPADIQVLDLSINRLRELKNNSFLRYTNVAYLYLGDNFIPKIEEFAFAPLRYLQVLDLSKNGLQKLPSGIFKMPYLRKIYLHKNFLTDEMLQNEITAPMEYLELTHNELERIPEIGPQAYMTYLNLSENKISRISTEEIAQFCSLKTLDLTKNNLRVDPTSCDCYLFKSWIRIRNIDFKPSFNCDNDTLATCSRSNFTNQTMESYEICLDIIKTRLETARARTTWIVVASCIASFLLFVICALWFVRKRNKKRRQQLKNEQRVAANNANTELLNSNLQESVYEPNEK